MLQNLPHHIPSPARLGLSNPNSPSLQSPGPPAPVVPKPSSQPHHSQQAIALPTPKTTSSSLLPLLPPLPRAQALLLQMASLASKLFEVSPNRAAWLSAFRGSLPTFLSSQILSTNLPPLDFSPSTTKEVLALFTSLQTQLFEAVAQLQEILDLQDAKQKLNHEIETNDAAILAFAKKLKEVEQVLDVLVDDYADYRRPKRSKSSSKEEDSSSNTTVASQLKLKDVLSYAHRISYTTFAPPEFGAGGPLRGALPPAPQEDQMRASQLYAFADLDVGLPKTTVEDKEKTIEPLIETPAMPPPDPMAAIKGLIPPNITVPEGWKPGMPVELPTDLPLPPPGWKPGDPVQLPPLGSLSVPARTAEQQQRPVAPPVFPKAPEPIQVPHVQLDILDQDDDSSDYSSDDVSSGDDD